MIEQESVHDPSVRVPPRHRLSPAWREFPASRTPLCVPTIDDDGFRQAVLSLARADEEIVVPEERGPIVFRDGVFQIDVENAEASAGIDPGLKGLIDSILNPTT